MTKSIKKAVVGDVLVKGNLNDTEPSYINVGDLKLNDKTLNDLYKEQLKAIDDLKRKSTELYKLNTELEKRVNTLELENKRLQSEIKALDVKVKDTIESWVKL